MVEDMTQTETETVRVLLTFDVTHSGLLSDDAVADVMARVSRDVVDASGLVLRVTEAGARVEYPDESARRLRAVARS